MTNNNEKHNENNNASKFAEFLGYSFVSIILVTLAAVGASFAYFMITWALGMR